jgi:hypothetical protein
MERSLHVGLVIVSVVGLVSSASADSGRKSRRQKSANSAGQQVSQQPQVKSLTKSSLQQTSGANRAAWMHNGTVLHMAQGTYNGNAISKPTQKIAPLGRSDVSFAEKAQVKVLPPSRGGYQFVDGHWERPQAGSGSVLPNSSIQVRYFRNGATKNLSAGESPGGVKVTISRPYRRPQADVTSSDRDHRD